MVCSTGKAEVVFHKIFWRHSFSLFAEFFARASNKTTEIGWRQILGNESFQRSIFLPLACFDLEIWFLSAKFSFYRGILQWFFFFHLSRNRRHRISVVFAWSSCKTSAKSDVRNFVKNNFCFASWTNEPKFKKLKIEEFRLF